MSDVQVSESLESELNERSQPKTRHGIRFEQMVAHTERRNFTLGIWNGVIYNLGMSFIAKSTIVPTFLSTLTASSALIGIVSQFDSIGWYLPQIFFSTLVVHRPQKMPLYRFSIRIGMVAFFVIALLTLVNPSPALLLPLFILCYGVYTISGGMRGVVFMELLAKAIPSRKRARFLGLRMSFGALAAATVGASAITLLLTSIEFPTNFGFVFLTGACIVTVSFFLMANMREPRTPNVPPKRTIKQQMWIAWDILKYDRKFRTFLVSRMLINCWTIGLPFIILFGRDELGFTTKDTGIFIAAECVGLILSNFLWEHIELKYGPKTVLLVSCIVGMLMPLFLLSFKYLSLPTFLFAAVFAIAAAFDAAVTIGGMGYLIEMTHGVDRSTYTGLFNSMMALPCFLTAGAGVLLDLLGYQALYAVVFAIAVWSFFRVRHLPEIKLKHR